MFKSFFKFYINQRFEMPIDRNWDQYKDSILKHIFQIEKISKWSLVAQRMADQYHIRNKTGIQCKQRYLLINDPSKTDGIDRAWTNQEEQKIFQLQQQHGSKWSVIATQLPFRNDNEIKNYYYLKLKKSLRKINRKAEQNTKKGAKFKQISQKTVYLITSVSNQSNDQDSDQNSDHKNLFEKSKNLKRRLYFLNHQCNDCQETYLELYKNIQEFNISYKKQSKKKTNKKNNLPSKTCSKSKQKSLLIYFQSPTLEDFDQQQSDDISLMQFGKQNIHTLFETQYSNTRPKSNINTSDNKNSIQLQWCLQFQNNKFDNINLDESYQNFEAKAFSSFSNLQIDNESQLMEQIPYS